MVLRLSKKDMDLQYTKKVYFPINYYRDKIGIKVWVYDRLMEDWSIGTLVDTERFINFIYCIVQIDETDQLAHIALPEYIIPNDYFEFKEKLERIMKWNCG